MGNIIIKNRQGPSSYWMHDPELARAQNLTNINTMVSDITRSLPVEDNSVDICLLSTVLHIFNLSKYGQGLYSEVSRVLKVPGCD